MLRGPGRLQWISVHSHFTSCSQQITAAPCNRLLIALTKGLTFQGAESASFALACWHPKMLCVQYINRCNTGTTKHEMPLGQRVYSAPHNSMAFVVVCPAAYGHLLICVLAPLFQKESIILPGLSFVLTQIGLIVQQISNDFRNDMKACQLLCLQFTGAWNVLYLESINLSAGFVKYPLLCAFNIY